MKNVEGRENATEKAENGKWRKSPEWSRKNEKLKRKGSRHSEGEKWENEEGESPGNPAEEDQEWVSHDSYFTEHLNVAVMIPASIWEMPDSNSGPYSD
jgi:hypothetical protein